MTKKKILVVTYGGGHVLALIPVLKKLLQNSDIELTVIGLTIAGTELQKAKIPYKTFRHYFGSNTDESVLQYGRELVEKWHVEGKGIELEDSILYLGLSMKDLVEEKGREGAKKIIETIGKKDFLPLSTMRKIIETEHPNLILTGNCPRAERAATLVAKAMKIPTINIHDYLAFEKRHILEADKIAVMSEITKQNLLNTGHREEQIVITGQPAFDSIVEELNTYRVDEIFREFNLSKNKKYILLGTQPHQTTEKMILAAIDAVKKLPNDFELIIKPHPGEDGRMHRTLLEKLQFTAHIIENVPIRKLIYISELMITFFSTIGLEAVLMKKPLMVLNFSGEQNPVPLPSFGVGIEINNFDDVPQAMQRLLYDEELKNSFLRNREKYFASVLDGKATERVVKLIYEMLDSIVYEGSKRNEKFRTQ